MTTPPSSPYSLTDIVHDVPLTNEDIAPEPAQISAIETYDLNLYVGTSLGELIHMFWIDDETGYMAVSRQQFSSKNKPIDKILLLPQVAKMLVLSGGTIQAYILPELSPANIGKIKDVNDMCVDLDDRKLDAKEENYIGSVSNIDWHVYTDVTVFTSKSIRLVRIFDDSMKLAKDLNYPGTLRGVRRSKYVAVGSQTSYGLIDLSQGQEIPLFPSQEPHPQIAALGKNEFLMACGSSDGPSMGMVVNFSGEISRGTFTWTDYPSSLEIDYPYLIGAFGKSLKIYSLHDQRLVQTLEFEAEVGVTNVSHLFKSDDDGLNSLLELTPIIYQSTAEEVQKIAEESDQHYGTKSSILVYDRDGKNIRLIKLQAKPLRLLQVYHNANKDNCLEVFDEILDEYRNPDVCSEVEKLFILHLLGLLGLKYEIYDQCYDLWVSNLDHLDPRLLLYALGIPKNEIFGSVWIFRGLADELEDIRNKYSDGARASEFLQLYLATCILEAKDRDLLKTIELNLARLNLESPEFLAQLNNIKYSKSEIIEMLLETKNYYYLAKFYEKLGDKSHTLYYWRKLLQGELTDPKFQESDPLKYMVHYLLTCDEPLVEMHGKWLLEKYPEYGLQLFMHPELKYNNFKDVKILQMLSKQHRRTYLHYLVTVKGEKQFMGDLILSLLRELMEMGGMPQIVEKYTSLPLPKLQFYEFLSLESAREHSQTIELHDQIYRYLLQISKDTMSILDRKNVAEQCLEIVGAHKGLYSLLEAAIYYKQGQHEKVVAIFLKLEDYEACENFARTLKLPADLQPSGSESPPSASSTISETESLQMLIFEKYLQLERPELIERFLNNNNVFQDVDDEANIAAKMDKFVSLLNRIPDTFPICRLDSFLVSNLISFQDQVDETTLCKNLSRALYTNLRELKD
ncbi:hypothetical protein KL907_002148 [Ogataea polymorpha]|uniref:Uncharacterized protein n=1 Tax=Ogataea polymorpha TaxID=460523 RepID=A0A1B7SPW1_9ASCO|nr:uncharacterized protein OGAPODRAFT_91991 [Ogataea polymorpha]KAG7906508.1 hypothetical protein KL907_002148 [Ogataea polymorpha]KAG7917455.1 hypothetical protein KL927_002198 [Ogataea polymorpha]KAG7934495.1 hypothetical protein KL934_002421 [Ogataea polymorpha]KAH3660615.1 hypothetical protein OGATHE_004947 [Ogataea polymorpha]OBA18510.1 hypothetical protein OGAPODRAFT_91991 [Ogataea polymorpha]